MARQLRREDYTVGWVCALPVELAAAQEMLDEEHYDLERDPADNDENLYALGSIGGHNVALGCLPAGQMGNNPAATVATQMRATFRRIRFGLMVGIGGGVPSAEADVRLGDVVVSQPDGTFAGVVQYDMGKTTLHGFKRTGSLNSPPQILLAAIARVRANELRSKSKLSEHISKLEGIIEFQRSRAGPDVLFEATYNHEAGQTCDGCNPDRQDARQTRDSGKEVAVHYGTIASGNLLMRSAAERDKVSTALGGVLCFEMEAAGLMNNFPCLVIRGICDYADSHKNKRWQAYAAGTAAAYAKEILLVIPPAEVVKTHTVEETIGDTVGLEKGIRGLLEERATAPPLDVRSNSLDQYTRKGPQFEYQTCDGNFRIEEAANQHMAVENHGSQSNCRTSYETSRSGQASNQRMTTTGHGVPKVSCKTCPKKFYTQSAADEHMTTTGHGIPKVSCKTCPRKFYTQSAADEHMRITGHGIPKVSCKTCTKKYYTQSAAKDHMIAVRH